MNDAGLHRGQRKDCADRLGEAFEPVDDRDQDVVDAAGLELVHHLQPELGALGLLDPQPEHLLLPVAVEGERDIDRFVAHQTLVANLDPQRVEEDDRVERPVLPFPNLLEPVAPAVEPAELGIPGAGQGRRFDALTSGR
jgi:hypothetical protein